MDIAHQPAVLTAEHLDLPSVRLFHYKVFPSKTLHEQQYHCLNQDVFILCAYFICSCLMMDVLYCMRLYITLYSFIIMPESPKRLSNCMYSRVCAESAPINNLHRKDI